MNQKINTPNEQLYGVLSKARLLIALALLMTYSFAVNAQVTIGSAEKPTLGALLDLKSQQTGANNETTGKDGVGGGLLLPRVMLKSMQSLEPLVTDVEAAKDDLKKRLTGLMVYNLYTDNRPTPLLYPGVYIWDGDEWGTSGINKSASPMYITTQPEGFTFYETGLEPIVDLEFKVEPPRNQEGIVSGTVTYIWYQITGNNVHVRVGEPVTTSSPVGTYAPLVLKGTTKDARNTGFYKFYCEATSSNSTVKLTSDIAEIAVGCGAKNNRGDWITFMCFNLGAENGITIKDQIETPITITSNSQSGLHPYVPGEEKVYGDLFQWGRIADGHEKRVSDEIDLLNVNLSDIISGNKCASNDVGRPYQQIKETVDAYGKFVTGGTTWSPSVSGILTTLWRAGRFVHNDPCAHYNTDGSYQEFWHNGPNNTADSPSCDDAGTSWSLPIQSDWIEIFTGVIAVGRPNIATANTWAWSGSNSMGFKIQPDGKTTTLFLPATGYRSTSMGKFLFYQGRRGYYKTTTKSGDSDMSLYFSGSNVNTGYASQMALGSSVRCVKSL